MSSRGMMNWTTLCPTRGQGRCCGEPVSPASRRCIALDQFGRGDDRRVDRTVLHASHRAIRRGRRRHVRVQPRGVPTPADGRVRIADGQLDSALPADVQAALQGSRAELVLQPSRFLFRPLELPRKASDFLEGIIRAQIDRLTPWKTEDAVFGWTAPVEIPNDRIVVNVIVTARQPIMSFVDTVSNLGVNRMSSSRHSRRARSRSGEDFRAVRGRGIAVARGLPFPPF